MHFHNLCRNVLMMITRVHAWLIYDTLGNLKSTKPRAQTFGGVKNDPGTIFRPIFRKNAGLRKVPGFGGNLLQSKSSSKQTQKLKLYGTIIF